MKLVQSYAIAATGAKFRVINITDNARSVILATQSGTSLTDNISTIYGTNFSLSLTQISFEMSFPGREDDEAISVVKVHGFISKSGLGVGRADADRQFVYCNSRPVDLPKVVKLMNEVWRRYEMKHKPAFFIFLELSAGLVDVNVTPNKSEVVFVHEDSILNELRRSVETIYEPTRSILQVQSQISFTSSIISRTNSLQPQSQDISTNSESDMKESSDSYSYSEDKVNEEIFPSFHNLPGRSVVSKGKPITPTDIVNPADSTEQCINLSSEESQSSGFPVISSSEVSLTKVAETVQSKRKASEIKASDSAITKRRATVWNFDTDTVAKNCSKVLKHQKMFMNKEPKEEFPKEKSDRNDDELNEMDGLSRMLHKKVEIDSTIFFLRKMIVLYIGLCQYGGLGPV